MFTTRAQFCEGFLLALCASGVEHIQTAQNAHRIAFEPIARRVHEERQISRHGIRISSLVSRGFGEEFDATLRWLQAQGLYDCRPSGHSFTPTISAPEALAQIKLQFDSEQINYLLMLARLWRQAKHLSVTPDEMKPPRWLEDERRNVKEKLEPED
jgi:hypothetical protein